VFFQYSKFQRAALGSMKGQSLVCTTASLGRSKTVSFTEYFHGEHSRPVRHTLTIVPLISITSSECRSCTMRSTALRQLSCESQRQGQCEFGMSLVGDFVGELE
jgi:hypothetical protein